MIIGVVKVTGEATLNSKGLSNGVLPCALILIGLSIDPAVASKKDAIAEEANVVTKEVVEGLSKGTSVHLEEVSAS